jgi:hypothetical protein
MEIPIAVEQRLQAIETGGWRTGKVTAISGAKVVVTVDNASMTLPKIRAYTPTVGDVVIVAARPGSWFVIGAIG